MPRVSCGACGKTTQVPVPWAREDSGFSEPRPGSSGWMMRCTWPRAGSVTGCVWPRACRDEDRSWVTAMAPRGIKSFTIQQPPPTARLHHPHTALPPAV
ncbi:MAG: hypothetical protein EOM92_17700 [Gammaproteobacteria bacterium]|nr:hypothetical protein [Gammaproteobacteria bacterium]